MPEHLQNLGPAPLIFVKNQVPRGSGCGTPPPPEASPLDPCRFVSLALPAPAPARAAVFPEISKHGFTWLPEH